MTAITDPKEAKKILNAKNEAIMKIARKLANEYNDGFPHNVLRQGVIGACIWFESRTPQGETLRAYVQLMADAAAVGGGIHAEPIENTATFIAMLTTANTIAQAYLETIDTVAQSEQAS